MKRVLRLNPRYDLYLSMTWMHDNNHGICGHVFELIEYYFYLKQHMDVGILICEDIDWGQIESCVKDKYSVTNSELSELKSDIKFYNRPELLVGNNILFVDGGLKRSLNNRGVALGFDNIIAFKCSPHDTVNDLKYNNTTVLQDTRVYNDVDSDDCIHYVKKIFFRMFKQLEPVKTDTAMLYGTKNCRLMSHQDVQEIVGQYDYNKYMILTSSPIAYRNRFKHNKNLLFPRLPVMDLFTQFDDYIYTPTTKNISFDCSPRFICECAYYNKRVIYHNIDDDHLQINKGLAVRINDLKNGLENVSLSTDDPIHNILLNIINK